MATELQYNILKSVYDEEYERTKSITNMAKVYLTISSLFLGGLALKITGQFGDSKIITKLTFSLAVFAFISAFLCIVRTLGIYTYEKLCYPERVLTGYDEPPEDSDFLDDRLADIAVAFNRNRVTNDRRTRYLRYASWCMFLGVIFSFIGITLMLFE